MKTHPVTPVNGHYHPQKPYTLVDVDVFPQNAPHGDPSLGPPHSYTPTLRMSSGSHGQEASLYDHPRGGWMTRQGNP